jgi:hypothetical protein
MSSEGITDRVTLSCMDQFLTNLNELFWEAKALVNTYIIVLVHLRLLYLRTPDLSTHFTAKTFSGRLGPEC